MHYRENFDPYHLHYYRSEYFQHIPQHINQPYPMGQQEPSFPQNQQSQMNHAYPVGQQWESQSNLNPMPQQEMNPTQPNQMNQPSTPPYSVPNTASQSQMNENNQTPFNYFQKPEQPMNWPNNTSFDPAQFQQNSQMPPGIISQFQNEKGQMDVDKVIGTVGQLAHTYHQVAPIFKQLGSVMKIFRGGA